MSMNVGFLFLTLVISVPGCSVDNVLLCSDITKIIEARVSFRKKLKSKTMERSNVPREGHEADPHYRCRSVRAWRKTQRICVTNYRVLLPSIFTNRVDPWLPAAESRHIRLTFASHIASI